MKQFSTFQLDSINECIVHNGTVRIASGQCVDGVQDQETHYPPLHALGHSTSDPNVNDGMHSHAPTWLLQFPSFLNETERQQWRLAGPNVARPRMLREVCELIDSLTREFPLLLSLEDLLWADFSAAGSTSASACRREATQLMTQLSYRKVDVIVSNRPIRRLKLELQSHQIPERPDASIGCIASQ